MGIIIIRESVSLNRETPKKRYKKGPAIALGTIARLKNKLRSG